MPIDPMIARPFVANPFAAFQEGRDQAMQREMNQMQMEQARNEMVNAPRREAEANRQRFFTMASQILPKVPPERRAEAYGQIIQWGMANGAPMDGIPPQYTPDMDAMWDAMAPAPENRIGTASPSDFTSESLAKYQQTGDAGVLVRQYPPQRPQKPAAGQIVMTNQGPMIFDPDSRQLSPAQVPGAAPGQPILPPAQDPELQREKAGATAQGKLEGTQAAEAPQQLYDIADATQVLTDLKSAAGFPKMFGSIRGRLPSVQQDTASADALRLRALDLLALISRGQLKGTGAITDFEQKMVRQARTTLENTTQDPKQAMDEVKRLLSWLEQKRSVAEQKASGRPSFSEAKEKRGALMDSRTNIDDLVNKYAD